MKKIAIITILAWAVYCIYDALFVGSPLWYYAVSLPAMIALSPIAYTLIMLFVAIPAEHTVDGIAYAVGMKDDRKTCVNCGTSVRWRDGDSLICPSCGQPLNVKLGKR